MPHHNTVVKLLQVFLEVRPGPHRTATTTSPKVAEGSATSAKDSPAVDPFDCEPSWSRTHHSTRDAARKARHCRAEKSPSPGRHKNPERASLPARAIFGKWSRFAVEIAAQGRSGPDSTSVDAALVPEHDGGHEQECRQRGNPPGQRR